MNEKATEVFDVPQRLKDRAMQFASKINFTFDTVTEPKPNRIAADIATVDYARQHSFHSNGSILERGHSSAPRTKLRAIRCGAVPATRVHELGPASEKHRS